MKKSLLKIGRLLVLYTVLCMLLSGIPVSAASNPKTLTPDYCWNFNITLKNTDKTNISLEKLMISHLLDGQKTDKGNSYTGKALASIGLKCGTLKPGKSYQWTDTQEITKNYNETVYTFYFTDSSGKTSKQTYRYQLSDQAPVKLKKGYLTPEYEADRWTFPMTLKNSGKTPLRFQKLIITKMVDGKPCQEPITVLTKASIDIPTLQPGKTHRWVDGHPFSRAFNEISYAFTFTDGNGKKSTQTFQFQLDAGQSGDQTTLKNYSKDNGKDLQTLRYNADFSKKVADGIYWVPARSLGKSRYTNAQIYAMLDKTPQQKQKAAGTLYEALQLYQISGFYNSNDNISVNIDGTMWESHKPGYDAVRTNNGCCASDSNWLNYILKDDYDEIGYIAISQRDGSGHIYNYIKQDGWYYFLDLTKYRASEFGSAVESGKMEDFRSSDVGLGNILKTKSLKSYVNYVQKNFGDPPGLMFQYTAKDCLDIACTWETGGKVTIGYGKKLKVLFDDPKDSLYYKVLSPSTEKPDWSCTESFPFPS